MPTPRPIAALLIAALTLVSAACGGYSQRLAEVRMDVQTGNVEGAVDRVTELVLTGEAGENPEAFDLPLLLLERGALQQALQRHREAVADFTQADPMLETLDLSSDGVGNAATYLWSESKSLYRPPVYEKLMVNAMALSSYLALGEYGSARVEARRIGVLVDYFETTELGDHPMLGAAAYLAGLAMELGGERESALRFYIDAYARADAPGLAEAVARLGMRSTLRGNPQVVRARESLGLEADDDPPEGAAQEAVIIAWSGLAPRREPQRFPIGAVIAWYRVNTTYVMTDAQQASLNRAVAEDLLTWINFPVLVVTRNTVGRISVDVDGRTVDAPRVADLESFAIAQWEQDRPGIAFAAITRALTRIVAREGVQAIGRAADSGNGVGQAVGFLAGLAAQGAMQAADQPDTRTWTFMPAYLHVTRVPVSAGTHTLTVRGAGKGAWAGQQVTIDVPEGGAGVATVRFLR